MTDQLRAYDVQQDVQSSPELSLQGAEDEILQSMPMEVQYL